MNDGPDSGRPAKRRRVPVQSAVSISHQKFFGVVLMLRLCQVRRNQRGVRQFLDLQAEVDHDGGCDHETDSGGELESECISTGNNIALIKTHDFASADFIEEDPVDCSAIQPTADRQFPSVQQDHEELVRRAEHFKQLSRSSRRLGDVTGAAITSESPLHHISNLASPPLWRIFVKVIAFSLGVLLVCVLRLFSVVLNRNALPPSKTIVVPSPALTLTHGPLASLSLVRPSLASFTLSLHLPRISNGPLHMFAPPTRTEEFF
jgi:hypothetical protein